MYIPIYLSICMRKLWNNRDFVFAVIKLCAEPSHRNTAFERALNDSDSNFVNLDDNKTQCCD